MLGVGTGKKVEKGRVEGLKRKNIVVVKRNDRWCPVVTRVTQNITLAPNFIVRFHRPFLLLYYVTPSIHLG